jgi:hypothetical protein
MHLIPTPYGDCYLRFEKYSGNGRTALQLIDASDHLPVCRASVNLPGAPCSGSHQAYIKDWSENDGIRRVLIEASVIGPEFGRWPTGHCVATLHTILIENLEEWNAEVDRAMEAGKAS